jgi:hypothetical protein
MQKDTGGCRKISEKFFYMFFEGEGHTNVSLIGTQRREKLLP